MEHPSEDESIPLKLNVEFKHLTIDSTKSLQNQLEKSPEIKKRVSNLTNTDFKPSDAFYSLDLSRNFYVSFDLNDAISAIVPRLSRLIDPPYARLFSEVSYHITLAV